MAQKWNTSIRRLLVPVIFVAVLVSSVARSLGESYHIVNLGSLIGATNSYAHGINDAGNIVGHYKETNDWFRAFLLQGVSWSDLGVAGTNTFALSINSNDHIVGYSQESGASAFHFFGGTFTDLGTLGGVSSYAHGINALTNIVGYIDTTNGAVAISYQAGVTTAIGNLGGTNAFAFAINDSALIVGSSTTTNGSLNAFVAGTTGITNLNDLIGGGSGWVLTDARGINESGNIVGWGITNGIEHAYILQNGSLFDITTFSGGTNSYALGLNDSNIVVGASSLSNGITHAFIWKAGVLEDLNVYLPGGTGWELMEARAINNHGQIVGWGKINGAEQAFLLQPNIPPVVTLTSPTNNVAFGWPATVELSAAAADSDGHVTEVQFFYENIFLGGSGASPFSLTWSNVPPGNYALTARAIDDSGGVATSSVVNVSVTLPLTNRIKLWLKADAITNLTNNASVATWPDSSGLTNNASQSSSTSRAVWLTNIVNGKPALRFDGVNDYFNLPNLMNGATQAEAFVVLRSQNDIPVGERSLWKFGTYSTQWMLKYPATDGTISDEFGSTGLYNIGDPAQALSGFHVYNVSTRSGEWTARVNGVVQYSSSTNTVGFSTTPMLGGGGGSYYFFEGDIAEVLIYDTVLTVEERNTIDGYLNRRFGLAGELSETPTNLVAGAVSPSQVSLQWDGKLDQGVTRVSVERKTGAGGTYSVVAEVRNARSFLDTGLSPDTAYYYRVRAINIAGWTAYSNEAGAVTPSVGTNMPLGELRLWLKADAGVAQIGTNVMINAWEDQSGKGKHVSQAVSANRPQWISGQINGRPVVHFDGTNDSFNLPNPMNGATQAEVFVVLRSQNEIPTAERSLWRFGTYTPLYPLKYPGTDGTIWDEFGSTGIYGIGDPAQALSGFHVYNVSTRSGEWTARVNGVLQYSSSTNTVAFSTSPMLGTGGYYFFGGDLAEVLIYDRVLTPAERNTVAGYLNKRFGLAGELPETPSNLVAGAVSPSQVSLQWDGKLDQGVTRVSVERKTGVGGTYAIVAEVQNGRSFLDTGLSPDTAYYYRARAINIAGWTAYSNEAGAVTPILGTGTNMPLAELRLWLKADAGVAQIGTNVMINAWEDQSGKSQHASQVASAKRPKWISGQINGRPVVHFDGTDDYFNLPNLMNGATQAEAFVVLRSQNDIPVGERSLWKFGTYSTQWMLKYPATDGTISDEFGSTGVYNIGDPAQALSGFHVYSVSTRTGEWTARVNGVVQYSSSTNTVGFSTTPMLGGGGGTYYFFEGDIAEVLIYDRVLTAAERSAVTGYLNGRFGLVGELPETPTNLVAGAVSPSQVSLQWDGKLDQGVTRVSVERKTGEGGTYSVVAEVQNARSFLDTGLSPDTAYYYRVRAINIAGWTAYSNEAGAVTPILGTGTNMPLGELRLWLKADAGVAQIGTNVMINAWEDQSGKSQHASQVASAKRPKWISGQINGRPVVHFDGTDDYFNLPNLMNGATQAEAFVVLRTQNDIPVANKSLWRFGTYTPLYSLKYPGTDGTIWDEFGSTGIYGIGAPLQALNGVHMYNVSTRSGEWTARLNGAVQYSSSTNTVGFSTAPMLGSGGYYTFEGDIAEVLVYDRVLTAAERNTVAGYLNKRFGFGVPETPTNLVAAAISTSQVNLQWEGKLDQATTRVSVERKGEFDLDYSIVGEVQNALSYLDTGLAAGTTYYYRVRAVNMGDSTEYSNEAVAITSTTETNLPIGNLRLWLKADAGLAQKGTNVLISSWQDQSGNGNHAFQTGSTSRPQWIAGQLNGRPIMRFDGINDYFDLANFLNGSTQAEAFVVLKAAQDIPSTGRGWWAMGNSGSSAHYPWSDGVIYEDFGSNTRYTVGNPTQSLDQYHIYNVLGKAGQWAARLNGVVQYSTTNNTYSYRTSPRLGTSASSYYFAGDVGEVLIFDRVLTDNERASANKYLKRRYFEPDSDADDLPDDWERQYTSDLSLLGRGDWDGDGVSDRQEYLQGTNPWSYDGLIIFTPLKN